MARHPAAALAYPTNAIGHLLDSVAGFFGSQADAQEVLRRMSRTQALRPSQALLLGPADASWWSFRLRTRRWANRAWQDNQIWFGDAWLVASIGALLAGVASAMHLSLQESMPVALTFLAFALATLAGAAAGGCGAWLSNRPAYLEAFSGIVRQQLVAGRWVLVVYGVPWEHQAGSVALLRECGIDGCAVSVVQRVP